MHAYPSDSFSREQIAAMVGSAFPARLKSCRRIPTGKYNVTYDVALQNDASDATPESVILRIAPPDGTGGTFYEIGMMAQEPEVHDTVRTRTTIPVAKIYRHDTSRAVVDRDFLIMEKLPGEALSELPNVTHEFYNRVLEQVGRMLAQLHPITAESYGYLGAHHCMEPQPDWPSAFHVMWNRLIDDIVGVGAYDDKEATMLRRLLDKCMRAFQRPVPSSLLHMDIWAQNILVDSQGNVTGLVDWDRALWGDPEIEFAVLDYCGISEPAFWRGYGRERDGSPEAQSRGVFYYLYEVQKYIVIHVARRHNRASATAYKAQVMEILSRAFG